MHIVDHANPLHDQFCRCRACKPSRTIRNLPPTRRVEVAALGFLALGLATWIIR